MKKYIATYKQDTETGWWVGKVPALDGCVTQGDTLVAVQERMREAIEATTGEDGFSFLIEHHIDIHVPGLQDESATAGIKDATPAQIARRMNQIQNELDHAKTAVVTYSRVGDILDEAKIKGGSVVERIKTLIGQLPDPSHRGAVEAMIHIRRALDEAGVSSGSLLHRIEKLITDRDEWKDALAAARIEFGRASINGGTIALQVRNLAKNRDLFKTANNDAHIELDKGGVDGGTSAQRVMLIRNQRDELDELRAYCANLMHTKDASAADCIEFLRDQLETRKSSENMTVGSFAPTRIPIPATRFEMDLAQQSVADLRGRNEILEAKLKGLQTKIDDASERLR